MRTQNSDAVGDLTEVLSHLVGGTRWWGRSRPEGRSPHPIVVELVGGTAGQAKALLKALNRPERVPVAVLVESEDRETAPRETVATLLKQAADVYRRAARTRRRRPLRFRRFEMAMVAYDRWTSAEAMRDRNYDEFRRACEKAVQDERGGLFAELGRLREPRGEGRETLAALAAILNFVGLVLAALTIGPLVEWLIRHFGVNVPTRRWFRRKLDTAGDSMMYEKLLDEGLTADRQDLWERWLVDAFLADIDAYYFWARRLNRSRLPLLCLPQAEPGTASGQLLVLLRTREQVCNEVKRRSAPVVVAWTGGVDPGAAFHGVGHTVQQARGDGARLPLPAGPGEPCPVTLAPGHVTLAAGAVAVALVVIGATVWPLPGVLAGHDCGQGWSLDPAVSRDDGQCVGVADGAGAAGYISELAAVSRQIERENRLAEKGAAVTVAFMTPMTPDNAPERRQVLSEVQGAYLAQRWANRDGTVGTRTPDIRLVLANPGRDYDGWKTVADRLKGMTDDRYPLRAVTGFNLSVGNTQSALRALTRAGIPVVGGPITADEMENVRHGGRERFPGMARTVPTNTDQARALVRFNAAAGKRDSALVVDRRPNDTYNRSLAAAFRKAVSPRTKPKEFESDSPTREGDVANQFNAMIDSICYSQAKNVYFAGRPVHLRLFLLELADRPCGKRKIRVITGSGASTVSLYLTGPDWKVLRDNPWLSLQYSAAGHPEMWRKGDFGRDRGFYTGTEQGGAAPRKLMRDVSRKAADLGSTLGAPVAWNDSRTMTAFDSVWLAANAIKSANNGRGASDTLPGLPDVRRQWANTYADGGVAGLTGWLCLDNDGNPYNKTVAIVTLDPAERTVHFVNVAWPEGRPSADCDVPGGS